MNVLGFSTGLLLALLATLMAVFAICFFLSRQSSIKIKLINCGLNSLTTLFCIEVFYVSQGLIPPLEYVQGQAATEGVTTLNDWVSSALVSYGDLYVSWALLMLCVFASYFVKRSAAEQDHTVKEYFYDHFGASGATAVLLTSLFYNFVAIPGYFDNQIEIFDKILFRGIIPFITVGLFFWVIINVIMLARRIIFQRTQDLHIKHGFEANLMHETLDNVSDHSALKRRLIEVVNITGEQPLDLGEYTQLIEQQAEMEREEIAVSTLYLHTAMWAIPVLGFLGTVWGIAEAVSNLIPLLKGMSASELGGSQLADSLAGLGVAFDTTLVALTLSLPAMALISLLEKSAFEDMLVRNRVILEHVRDLHT